MLVITTPRLVLKPIEYDEAEKVTSLISEKINRWTRLIPWPYELHHAHEWILNSQPLERLGIYLPDGELIGTIRTPLADDDEIGFWISEAHEGKGYMTEAADAVTQLALENFQLNYISSSAHIDNIASIRVHEKLGFKRRREGMDFWPNRGKNVPVIFFRLSPQTGF